jgi:hypothetical protein
VGLLFLGRVLGREDYERLRQLPALFGWRR